jgi:NAD(P)-dependent dehydrogenase (short-subunit alcohol dehydrogenase family)
MDLRLKGKTALVTGSSDGIGVAIAHTLAGEGATVIVHGRNAERADAVARDIRAAGGIAHVATGMLDSDASVAVVFEAAVAAAGAPDILVNNAGIYRALNWLDVDPAQWLDIYNANVVSIVRLVRLAVPAMRERGWGRVIQIASVAASVAPPGLSDYAASKAALVSLSVSLAKALANTGITVNTVSPGPVVTPNWNVWALDEARRRGWGTDLDAIKQRMLQEMFVNPSGRLGVPEDIAAAVAYLASPLAGYVNGSNLRVDGGSNPTVN